MGRCKDKRRLEVLWVRIVCERRDLVYDVLDPWLACSL